MAFGVKVGRTTRELDAIFRLRHRVYVDEEGYFRARPDGRIADRFDAYPKTANLVALELGRVVGTVRVTLPSDAGRPTDEFFDYSSGANGAGERVCNGSMLCVARAHRETPRLVFALLGMAYFWARSQGMTHMLGAINPDVEAFFTRAGARRIAPPVRQQELGLSAVPMLIDLERLPGGFPGFVARQRLTGFPDSFGREFLQPGETYSCHDADECVVVVDGRVAVECQSERRAEVERGRIIDIAAYRATEPQATEISALSPATLMILDGQLVAVEADP